MSQVLFSAKRRNLKTTLNQGNFKRTADGFLSVPIVIAKRMVLEYPQRNSETIYELFDVPLTDQNFIDSCNGLPFVLEHPEQNSQNVNVDSENYNEFVKGVVVDPYVDLDKGEILGTLKVWDKNVINMIENGELVELSQGYNCFIVEEPGELNGEKYDYRQTGIVMNHIALVNEGRAGDKVKILTNKKNSKNLEFFLEQIKRGENMRKRRQKLNSRKLNEKDEMLDDEKEKMDKMENENGDYPEKDENESLLEKISKLSEKIEMIENTLSKMNVEEPGGSETEKSEDDIDDIKEEILESITNSSKQTALKNINEINNTYSKAQSILGADLQTVAQKHNSLDSFRREVLEISGVDKNEIRRMNSMKVEAYFDIITDKAKVDINAARFNANYKNQNSYGDIEITLDKLV